MTFDQRAWYPALGAVIVGVVAVVTLYFDGFAAFVAVWSSTEAYQFLFLVPVVSLYFIWLRFPAVSVLTPRPALAGLAYAAPFGALWLLGQAAQLSIAGQVAAVGMLQAVFLAMLGWQVTKQLLFPLVLLWLMVPFGDLLVPSLIELTTVLTFAGLGLAGLPASMDGNLLVAGGARYAIIQECTGLDFLLGNLLVSLAFANLVYREFRRKLVYVLAGIVVAILANGFRTTSVVLITAGGIDLAADHEAYGWFVFLIAMLLQMAAGLRFRSSPPATRRATGEGDRERRTVLRAARSTAAVLGGFVLLAAVAPAGARLLLDRDGEPTAVSLCPPPAVLVGAGEAADAWRPEFPAAGARLHGLLSTADRPVDFFVAYYWRQGPASKLIGSANRLHDGVRWRYVASGTRQVRLFGRPVEVATERQVGGAGMQRLVWYWYWADGRFSHRPWEVKLRQAKAVLFGGDERSALIAVSTAGVDGDAAPEILQAALDQLPAIGGMLAGATRGDAPGRACATVESYDRTRARRVE